MTEWTMGMSSEEIRGLSAVLDATWDEWDGVYLDDDARDDVDRLCRRRPTSIATTMRSDVAMQ